MEYEYIHADNHKTTPFDLSGLRDTLEIESGYRKSTRRRSNKSKMNTDVEVRTTSHTDLFGELNLAWRLIQKEIERVRVNLARAKKRRSCLASASSSSSSVASSTSHVDPIKARKRRRHAIIRQLLCKSGTTTTTTSKMLHRQQRKQRRTMS
jgi:hypothetical protein